MKNIFQFLFLALSVSIFAQNKEINQANNQYEKFAYIDAINIYEKVLQKGHFSTEILEKLANSYYFNANYVKAAEAYKKLIELDDSINPEFYYRYAQALKSTQNYDLANTMMNRFVQKSNQDNRAILHEEQGDYMSNILINSGKHEVKNAGNNSKVSDYGPSFYQDKIVFASTRDSVGGFVKKHSWNNQPFSNLYIATIQEDGQLVASKHLAKLLNSAYHESTPVFTKDGKTMYFTRNDFKKGEVCKDKNSNFLLSIYKTTFSDEKWSEPIELPFNGDDFMTAHPALSNDDKTLYFSSNRHDPKAFGDIYKVAINDDGTYGEPINLGNVINTNSRETFPFIAKDNFLYFASDGHPGLGGLDVFAVKINDDGSLQKPINLSKPVNTELDDFAYIIDSDSKKGYFSSNRKTDNFGDDDIYFVKQTGELPIECIQKISGKIIDKDSNLPISNASIIISNADKQKIAEVTSDQNGFYVANVDCNATIYITVSKPDFLTVEEAVKIPAEKGTTEKNVILENKIKKVGVGDDLTKPLNINIIYFDLNKNDIRKDAAVELSKILIVLQENPTIKIEIKSHTDSRNSHEYNQALSQRRAIATMQWLINNGIDKNRLTAKGFGESQLINNCADGINCTEEQHQLNRRSEFIITKID